MNEFWAAIAGAVIGAVATGAISLGLHWLTIRSARRDRKEVRKEEEAALALKLFYTLQKAVNDLEGLDRHVEEGKQRLGRLGGSGGTWRGLVPIGNLPRDIEVSPAELTVVFRQNRPGLFNDIRDVEAVHNAALKAWERYATLRQELAAVLPADMTGLVGTTALSTDERRRAGPTLAAVESLAEGLSVRAPIDAELADRTLEAFLPLLKKITGYGVQISRENAAVPSSEDGARH